MDFCRSIGIGLQADQTCSATHKAWPGDTSKPLYPATSSFLQHRFDERPHIGVNGKIGPHHCGLIHWCALLSETWVARERECVMSRFGQNGGQVDGANPRCTCLPFDDPTRRGVLAAVPIA